MSDQSKALVSGSVSERFTQMVIKEFSGAAGAVQLTQYQKKLTQHLFIKVDAQLKDLEAKRVQSNSQMAPYEWSNINMEKLAIDTVHRVDLGLDALIPNHLSPIPYFSKKKQKYDLDLRIGYEGKDYYRRKMSKDEPLNIIYELVYENDHFKPIKKSMGQEFDAYEFEIQNPFDRGDIIGGFGYIIYPDKAMNELVIVSEKEFLKSKSAAKSKDFWNSHPEKMRMKTLVHRTTEKLKLDPEKINASFLMVESDTSIDVTPAMADDPQAEIDQNANSEPLEADTEPQADEPMTEEEKAAIQAEEAAAAKQEPRKAPF